MATSKKTTIIESDEPLTDPQHVHVINEQSATQAGMSKQNIITIAIAVGFVLFFIGLGLGYLLGSNVSNSNDTMRRYDTKRPMMQRGVDGTRQGGMTERNILNPTPAN